MGLWAYMEDAGLLKALEPHGEIIEVIRLKYKADHDLAGLENRNPLVWMVLSAPSIPHSLKIADEWCRISHNNQQPVCRECNQLGHSHCKCPTIKCNLCNVTSHMSMDCDKHFDINKEQPTKMPEQTQDNHTDTTTPESAMNRLPALITTPMDSSTPGKKEGNSTPPLDPQTTSTTTPMESSTSLKRSHTTDSDLDNTAQNLYCDVQGSLLNLTLQLLETKSPPLLKLINTLTPPDSKMFNLLLFLLFITTCRLASTNAQRLQDFRPPTISLPLLSRTWIQQQKQLLKL